MGSTTTCVQESLTRNVPDKKIKELLGAHAVHTQRQNSWKYNTARTRARADDPPRETIQKGVKKEYAREGSRCILCASSRIFGTPRMFVSSRKLPANNFSLGR